MNTPFIQLLGSVTSKEGLLKEIMYRIQDGSTFEVLNNLAFFLMDSSVLSPFDWILNRPTPIFVVAKIPLIDDIMKSGGKNTINGEKMVQILKDLLFKKISHIHTSNQPFPSIYSDDKKFVLDPSILTPLTYEESFDVQMTRCYIRLLADIPFLIFYEDNGINYWMIQSFSESGSVTNTIIDSGRMQTEQNMQQQLLSQLTSNLEAQTTSYSSLFLFSPSTVPFHTLLHHNHSHSFASAIFRETISPLSSPSIIPSSNATCELLLRYTPQPYSTLFLDADRLNEELQQIKGLCSGSVEWKSSSDPADTLIDYTDSIYRQAMSADSIDAAMASVRQALYSIPILSPPPSLSPSNHTHLAELVRRGLRVVGEVMSHRDKSDELLDQWRLEVDLEKGLVEDVLEAGLFSINERAKEAFVKRRLLVNELTTIDEGKKCYQNRNIWSLAIQQYLRLLGFVGLLESMNCFKDANIQFCVNVLQKVISSSSASTVLIALPTDIAVNILPTLTLPEIGLVRKSYKEGKEVQLELNEKEVETSTFFSTKQMMRERYLTMEDEDEIVSILKFHCGEEITKKAMKSFDLRKMTLNITSGYYAVEGSVKLGNTNLFLVCFENELYPNYHMKFTIRHRTIQAIDIVKIEASRQN